MNQRKIKGIDLAIPPISLGTWAFGGGSWWGRQEDRDSVAVLEAAVAKGVTLIDTAPIYGKGRSERIVGSFIRKRSLRQNIILATKVGLSWQGAKIFHNLKKKRILEEVDQSRKYLATDYFDLYQVHWPDPDTPISETAETMQNLHQQGTIKSIGVSNFSVKQMTEFMKYSPLHCLQPEYSLFNRDVEEDVVSFCVKNNIAILTYSPLYSGLLTGKFFFNQTPVPDDLNRRMKGKDLTEPRFSINRQSLEQLKDIAANYNRSLTQLAINWNFSQPGITSTIVGMRNLNQAEENFGSLDWVISDTDLERIGQILKERKQKIAKL